MTAGGSYHRWLQIDTRSWTSPVSRVPVRCVRAGVARASLFRPVGDGCAARASALTAEPSGPYGTSSPGRERWARYRTNNTPQGEPDTEGGLIDGHCRHTSLP